MLATFELEEHDRVVILAKMQPRLDAMDLETCNERLARLENRLQDAPPKRVAKLNERKRLIQLRKDSLT